MSSVVAKSTGRTGEIGEQVLGQGAYDAKLCPVERV